MSSLCCLPLLSSWNNEHLSKLLINTHPQENKIMLPANRLCEYMLALLFCFWLLLSSWDDSIWQQNSKTFTSVTHKKKVCCICKSNLNIFVNLFHTVTGLYIGRNYPTLKKKKKKKKACSLLHWSVQEHNGGVNSVGCSLQLHDDILFLLMKLRYAEVAFDS